MHKTLKWLLCLLLNAIVCTSVAGGKKITAVRFCGGQTDYFSWACTGLIPWCWYGLITLGVPLLTGAFQVNVSRFKEHSWTVIGASLTVLAVIFLIQRLHRRIVRIFVNFYFATKTPKH